MTQAALFLTAVGVLSFNGPGLVDALKALLTHAFDPALLSSSPDPNQLVSRFGHGMVRALTLSMPLLIALSIAGLALDFAQIRGLIFSKEALAPKFSKLNPIAGVQNLLLKPKTYLELAKSLVKFAVIGWVAYSTINSNLRDIIVASRLGVEQFASLVPKTFFALLFKIGGAFIIVGAADFALQKKLFMKNLMMSKEEVKREFKEQEGDPHVKHQRRHLHMELLRSNAVKRVPQASVVVVNPTHLAVALLYDDNQMNAPQVLAKGETLLAQKIRSLAEYYGVPVIQNIPLAHSLYKLEVDDEIPEDLYQTVAEVLNLASELSQKHEN